MNANNALPANKLAVPGTLIGWLKQLGIAALYLLFGAVILHYFTNNGIVSVFWPGSGLVLAVLLIGGRRYIWGALLGALLVNAPLAYDSLVWVAGATLADVLEALLAIWLLTRNDKFSSTLNTFPDYLRLIVLGGAVASIVGAIIGALSLLLAGFITPADYFGNALHWWMGETLGVVLIAPLILAWWQAKSERSTNKQRFEGLLLVGIAFIAGQIVFLGWFNESLLVQSKAFMMLIPIAWIAIRLGIRSTTFALNMVAIQALSGAYLKVGYFADEIAEAGLQNYWFFMLILSVVGMALAVYVNEIKKAKGALHESNQKMYSLLNSMAEGAYGIDTNGNCTFLNQSFLQILGYENSDEIIGKNVHELIHHSYPDGSHYPVSECQIYEAYRRNQKAHASNEVFWRKDGIAIPVEYWSQPIISDGVLTGAIATFIDISERKQAELELRIAAATFESQEGMFVTDAHCKILRVNRAFTDITGYTAEEVISKNPSKLSSGRQDANFYAAMWESINNTGAWSGEIWNRRKNGQIYPERLTITAVKNTDGIITHYVATLSDITQSKMSVDEIELLAFYDPLTGLPNQRLLWDRLKSALASSHRSGRKGALLFIDMDNFKIINDTLGHDMGDLLLQQVAQRLVPCVREGDTVARLGGAEFVVMLEDLSKQALEAATQTEVIGVKILAALNQPYRLATQEYLRTSSIGATLFKGHKQSIDELLKRADIALYQAKSSGRNTLRFFDPQMQANIFARIALEADLRLALAENQFKLHYQPQVCHNRQIIGAEGLIRWQHPVRGLVSPANFIPLAEETGLILAIGQWVLEMACAQIKIWEGSVHTRHLQLAVNVSARQFHQVNFVEQVIQVLRHNAINPDRLKLELTESLVLHDIDDSVRKMNALRKVGVRFSMDDFGTGYSSLAYLTKLPLDQLKIDRSFVHNIGVKTTDAVIVQTIIGMANHLGMAVIAEGVETEAQYTFLEQHDCHVCQGYLFSKPVPIEQFESLQLQI